MIRVVLVDIHSVVGGVKNNSIILLLLWLKLLSVVVVVVLLAIIHVIGESDVVGLLLLHGPIIKVSLVATSVDIFAFSPGQICGMDLHCGQVERG